MSDDTPPDSPLEAATGSTGSEATEALSVLGNDTRLSIMLALWEATDPFAAENAVSFSELRERVGRPDSGQFNYHLGKLEGHFIRKTDAGYELRHSGERIVRTIIGTAGFESPSVEPAEIDMPCRHCGANTAISYEDEWLFRICTVCEGTFQDDEFPDGCLSVFPLAPAAVTDRTPEEMFAVAKFQALQSIHNKMEGICPECSGAVYRELEICDDHGADGICNRCGRADPIRVRLVCEVCKNWSFVPVTTCLMFHPEVIQFYKDHDITLLWNVDDFETMRKVHDLIVDEVELVADESSQIHVTYKLEGDELHLTLDEALYTIK